MLLRTLARAMGREGFEVATATSAGHAIRMMAEQPWQAVISDYMLGPGGDGLSVLSAAARFHPRSVRILLTGSADASLYAAAEGNAAITHLLHKPIELSEIRRILRAAALPGSHRARAEVTAAPNARRGT